VVEEAMVVSVREFVFVTVGSVVVSLVVLAAVWPWARQIRRLVVIGLAMAVGIVVWNLALNIGNATALNVDSPVLGLPTAPPERAVVDLHALRSASRSSV
jgi:hypothetical protein